MQLTPLEEALGSGCSTKRPSFIETLLVLMGLELIMRTKDLQSQDGVSFELLEVEPPLEVPGWRGVVGGHRGAGVVQLVKPVSKCST